MCCKKSVGHTFELRFLFLNCGRKENSIGHLCEFPTPVGDGHVIYIFYAWFSSKSMRSNKLCVDFYLELQLWKIYCQNIMHVMHSSFTHFLTTCHLLILMIAIYIFFHKIRVVNCVLDILMFTMYNVFASEMFREYLGCLDCEPK